MQWLWVASLALSSFANGGREQRSTFGHWSPAVCTSSRATDPDHCSGKRKQSARSALTERLRTKAKQWLTRVTFGILPDGFGSVHDYPCFCPLSPFLFFSLFLLFPFLFLFFSFFFRYPIPFHDWARALRGARTLRARCPHTPHFLT